MCCSKLVDLLQGICKISGALLDKAERTGPLIDKIGNRELHL